MSRHTSLRALAAAIGFAGVAGSCSPYNNDVAGPSAAKGEIFDTYVAIGNSITAGFQSSGMVDSVQKRSYAFLLAQVMGTRFQYPSLNAPGCPPMITSFLTQARPAGTTATTCGLRANNVDILNNVAVPGAWSGDPSSSSTVNSSALTTFILGGKTQVKKALEANPTFVSVWIGNNDLLGPAISSGGTATSLATITTQAAFDANYNAIVDVLKTARPNIKGVLIGVVNWANAPIMFRASNFATTSFKTAFDAIACGAATSGCFGVAGGTTIHSSCTSTSTVLINTFIAFQIRTGAHPALVACTRLPAPFAPVGDVLVLDDAEQASVTTIVTNFNTFISTKATALGFAYVDPNPTLVTLKAAGALIRNAPNYTSATAPFGSGMSLDGVHPAATVHTEIANVIIAAINAKYSTALPAIQ